MADGNKEWITIGNVRFSLEIDRCLPFHVIPDRAEMQRRYWLGQLRRMVPGLILGRLRRDKSNR